MSKTSDVLCPRMSRIGLGCVTFGREIDETAAFVLMDHASRRGVSIFDTAARYSDGLSERIVGRWLHSRRPVANSIAVATKVYPPFTPDLISSSAAMSLERMGLDFVDVLFLHKWDESAEEPEVLRALHALVDKGVVRYLGVSNFDAPQLGRVLQLQSLLGVQRFRLIQNNHNFAVRTVDSELKALCATEGITIVSYSPLGAGFLTGKHTAGVVPGSRFNIMPGHQSIYFTEVAAGRLAQLERIAQRTGLSSEQVALAWVFSESAITTVLVGGRDPSHLDQAFTAMEIADQELFTEY